MPVISLSHENFDEVVDNNHLVLLDFWAPWCQPCLAFAEIYEACSADYPDIVFAKVNVDEESQLANDFNVRSIPLLMVLREQVVVFAESGSMPKKALIELIEQARMLNMAEIHQQIKEFQNGKE